MIPMRGRSNQRGVVLVVGLIVLVMMTLTILSAVRLSTSNLQAVSNMHARDAALAAANVAAEEVISTDFVNAPAQVTIDVDLEQDGDAEYTVNVPMPGCRWWQPTPTSALDLTDPRDQTCFTGSAYQAIIGGTGTTFCADTLWEVRAQVNDAVTGAVLTINQGIKARMNVALAENSCE